MRIPKNNFFERKYIVDTIFNNFLGLEYTLQENEYSQHWEIKLCNGTKLIFEDHFFSKFLNDLEYMKFENIPQGIEYAKNRFTPEEDIPVIYGNIKCEVENQKITCGIDIFASCFFMLTRWEEYVNKNRDIHDRFSATQSLAYKENFLDRPVVNEYLEMLWNMLVFLGCEQTRRERHFTFYLTHDVDAPLKYTSWRSGLKEIIGDVIKRKNPRLAFQHLFQKIKAHLNVKNDPFNTFDSLMDIAESCGTKNYFFFMGQGLSKYDNYYKSNDLFIQKLAQKIKQRKHFIGIHPTYEAYNKSEQFLKEKKELEDNLRTQITFGRHHYLRFEIPTSWQIWEEQNMEWDSTLCYADKEGFRCGVCYEYNTFNFLSRKKLHLKEKPLIAMEVSFTAYQPDINACDMEHKIKVLINTVKKYNGDFVFLWHNSSFNTPQWAQYQHIFTDVLVPEISAGCK